MSYPLDAAPIFAAALYLGSFGVAIGALRGSRRSGDFEKFRRGPSTIELALMVAAVCSHSYSIVRSTFFPPQMWFGFAPALSSMLLVATIGYIVESQLIRIGAVRLFVIPLAALAVMLPMRYPGAPIATVGMNAGFGIHFLLALTAYGLLAISAVDALAMALIDVVLHSPQRGSPSSKWRSVVFEVSPPLLAMEQLLFHTLALGFAALTLTLVTGIGFHEKVFGRPLAFDHKTVFSIVSWLTFAVLLIGRWRYGLRGKAALRYVFAGFGLLLLAYIGTHFVLEVVLGRP